MTTWRPAKSDYALVALLLVVTVLPYVLAAAGTLSIGYAALGLVHVLPLLWRRRAPTRVFFVIVLGCAAQLWVTDMVMASDIGLFVAYYTVIVRRGWRRHGVAATIMCGVGAVAGAIDWVHHAWAGGAQDLVGVAIVVFVNALCIAVVGALGEVGRRRVELVDQLRARALAAEHERDQQMIIAAQTERARIAREMHDVVAHALAVIVVQADGAGHALTRMDSPPEVATRALETIGGTARQALGETRALVGVLREGTSGVELDPARTLADLPAVVEQLRGSATRIHLDTGGIDLARVPDGMGRALLRVAQEAITNALKHAGPSARIWITVRGEESRLVLLVDDDGYGPTARADGRGSGLIGMHERVVAHAGTMDAGARPGGGFRVRAQIPWPAGQDTTEG